MKKELMNVIKIFSAIIGALVGLGVYTLINTLIVEIGYGGLAEVLTTWTNIIIVCFLLMTFAIIFYISSPKSIDYLSLLEKKLRELSAKNLVLSSLGLVIGLFIAYLLSQLIDMIPISWISVPISIVLYIVLGYLGIAIALNKFNDWQLGDTLSKNSSNLFGNKGTTNKILDTSAIIDGRIYEITKIGFIEGKIFVPQFVLTELRHIADSSDELKRNRGRRGLDILNAMQTTLDVEVEVIDKDYDEPLEVDAKLIKLASEIKAKVVTNDYNLNKVAAVQGVEVLNVNELSNAVKPIALPGETMQVKIIKAGKEQQQGVAFLGDGTMIVVQEAKNRIGENLFIEVTSSLQTSAGRMIFARIIEN